jgi:ribosomal-protein-alanine N-acetyltransferase
MICQLETARLTLKALRVSDAETTQRLFPHWEIVQYLANQVPGPFPADGALSYYRDDALPAMARREAWHRGLWLKGGPGLSGRLPTEIWEISAEEWRK